MTKRNFISNQGYRQWYAPINQFLNAQNVNLETI